MRSLIAVERFYDKLMPEMGLPEKDSHIIDSAGNWRRAKPGEYYNTIEYHEKPSDGRPAHFIGFIEDSAMKLVSTRIAFRVASVPELDHWIALLRRIGACDIEVSSSYEDWPAVFFEDVAGTKLEVVARES